MGRFLAPPGPRRSNGGAGVQTSELRENNKHESNKEGNEKETNMHVA